MFVLWSTTDPAAHLAETLEAEVPGLEVTRINPREEFERYRQETLDKNRGQLTPENLELLDEELQSPCYEEVAVFLAFTRIAREARQEFIVMDTASTGRTLLLLDTTGAYHREVMDKTKEVSSHVTTPLMRLRDPDYTKVILVTTAETMPVLEAESLQEDLRRAGVEPFAWVINASLSAAAPRDRIPVERALAEFEPIEALRDRLAHRLAIVPFLPDEPVGPSRLLALAREATSSPQ